AGIKEGSSREDFTKGFERAREEMQGRRESDGDDRGRSDDRSRNSSSSGYTPAKRDRVTMDLPESFADRDVDRDGQIGLYEWREWDRTRVDEFFFFDRNGDGFLTPAELAAVDGGNEEEERGGSDRGRSREPERPSQPRPQPPQAIAAVSTSLDESDANVRQGRMYFSVLDANRDGRASVEELGKLKKLRPMFEEAGVRLDQDMTGDEFVANYAKAAKNKAAKE
ncbi:MAG: hypothetical protein M3552_00010, partial [Planctomycetota bacterium]|nr:hypothetical protein [Planctomycetota bacterium]